MPLAHSDAMQNEWAPQSAPDLRRQAGKLQKLAAYVTRPDVSARLRAQAAELLAQAELMVVQGRP